MLECSHRAKTQGEAWEFYEKKGKLYLSADNDRTLSYALSFLGRLKPHEAIGFLGAWKPKFPVRALYFSEEVLCPLEKTLSWGFNTAELSVEFSKAKEVSSRDKTLLEITIQELENSTAEVFYSDEPSTFLDLDFVPGERMLSFSDEAIWELLLHSPPLGTPLLPMVKLEEIKERLPLLLNRMARHPFKGIIVEAPFLPEAGSQEEKALLSAGFGCYLGVPHELFIAT